MNIIIKTKNLELTDSLQSYISKRIEGLKKFSKDFSDIVVSVEKETLHHRKGQIFCSEATINLPGKIVMAAAKGDDLGKTITKVRNELKEEIRKYKLKFIELPRRKAKKSRKEIF